MKTQEELMNKYMNIVKTELWKDNTRRQERARKECAHIVEFSNGNIVVLEKPILKKDCQMMTFFYFWPVLRKLRNYSVKG